MAEKNTAKPDIPSCPGSLYPPVSESSSKHLGKDHGSCRTCNQLKVLVPSTSSDFCGLVVADHPCDVGGFTDSEGPHDKLEEAQAIVTPQPPEQAPESTPPESPEKLKKEITLRKKEQVSNYTDPLQKALEEYVDVDLITTSRSGSYVCCIVDSCEVTDFASFVKNVFYIGVHQGVQSRNQWFLQGDKMVAKFEKIWEGKGKVKEVSLGLDPKSRVSAKDVKVLMVDCYGEKNLTHKANRNPQLLNVDKIKLSQEMPEPQKSKRGVYFLKQAWKEYEDGKSVIEIKRSSADPIVDVERQMGATSLSSQSKSSPK